jgi:hypothetical protein
MNISKNLSNSYIEFKNKQIFVEYTIFTLFIMLIMMLASIFITFIRRLNGAFD